MIKEKLFWRGVVLGLIVPTLAFIIYSNIIMDGDFYALYLQLKVMDVHTHVLSLCAFLNLLPFLIFVRTNREKPAQGILMITIILALIITIDKFLF